MANDRIVIKAIREVSGDEPAQILVSSDSDIWERWPHSFRFADEVQPGVRNAPTSKDVGAIVSILRLWVESGLQLTVACDAGMCRSTAIAFVGAAMAEPERDPKELLNELMWQHPEDRLFWPNHLIVFWAEQHLGRTDLLPALQWFKGSHETCWIDSGEPPHACGIEAP